MVGKNLTRSPLAPEDFPYLPPISGVDLYAVRSGSRYRDRLDLMLAHLQPGTTVAGVFTRSTMPSAAVDLCRAHLRAGKGRAGAIIVNAGIANAFTGKAGARAAKSVCSEVAKRLGIPVSQVFMASTGVIGQDLDPSPIVTAVERALTSDAQKSDWAAAAEAICTTDTFAKAATRSAKFGNKRVSINVIAKGSGMIAPDMATMLAFGFTDAAIPARLLQKLLAEATDQSFNAITVDGDTSTSDTVLLCATGAKPIGGGALKTIDDERLAPFRKALRAAMQDVAIQVASDGEGAQKLMTISVDGAHDAAAARRIGLAIGNSPLVKTAVAGEDANWGRIVMAIGKSGERADRDRLSIRIGGHQVARHGRAVDGYDEGPVAQHMQGRHIDIAVHVGVGKGRARVWACDLTHGYISINADYRS